MAGSALALGYYRNPEQTKKAFVQNPLNDRYLEPIYRTGDLAFYNENGSFASLHVRTSRLSIWDIELSLVRLRQQWINFLRFEEVCVFTIRQK